MSSIIDNKIFLERSKEIHGDSYDYSLTEYFKMKFPVIIICPRHGKFEQLPMNHLRNKTGCPNCSKVKNIDDFKIKANLIHKNKYNYSLVKFNKSKDKIVIICNEHGKFEQTVNSHLRGRGCSLCSKNKKMTTDEFINKAMQIHGNMYDYSLTNYRNMKTKIDIICKEHGTFMQSPDSHLKGFGCTSCSEFSKGESIIKEIINKLNIEYQTQKTFDGCRDINKLCFDFYLPKLNLCIEFDGRQHFEPIEFFGGIKSFNKLKRKDSIKNKYCEDNNIKLLRIPYCEIDNIEKIISEELWL